MKHLLFIINAICIVFVTLMIAEFAYGMKHKIQHSKEREYILEHGNKFLIDERPMINCESRIYKLIGTCALSNEEIPF